MVSGFTLFFSVLISIAQFGNNKAYDTENDHDRDQNTQHRTQKHNHDCSDQDNGKLAIPGTKIDVKTTALYFFTAGAAVVIFIRIVQYGSEQLPVVCGLPEVVESVSKEYVRSALDRRVHLKYRLHYVLYTVLLQYNCDNIVHGRQHFPPASARKAVHIKCQEILFVHNKSP